MTIKVMSLGFNPDSSPPSNLGEEHRTISLAAECPSDDALRGARRDLTRHNSGNLKLDLVHNFFLELGARATTMRVYEMASDPTDRPRADRIPAGAGKHARHRLRQGAREALRGGRLEALPHPELSTHQFPEYRKYIEMGLYNTMYSFSPSDYRRLAEIWSGPHPDGAPDLTVSDQPIPTLADPPPAESESQLAAPVPPPMDPGFLKEAAQRIFGPSIVT